MRSIPEPPTPLDDELRAALHGLGDASAPRTTLQRLAEQAREATRNAEIFQQLIENVHEVLWITDWERRQELYVSKSYETIWGRSCLSLYDDARSWIDNVHPDDQERVGAAFERDAERGTYEEEYRIIHADGSIRWIYDRAIPIRDSRGRVYRMAGISEDITQRKQAELAVEEARDELERRVQERTARLSALNTQLRRIVQGTSSTVDEAFFRSLVQHLAGALGVRLAFVSELQDPEGHELRLLACWDTDHHAAPFTYDPAGTPCEQVLQGHMCFQPHGVRDLFPSESWVREHGVDSYLAIPLFDVGGHLLGHMGVSHSGPLGDSAAAKSILQIFAARALAELARKKAERDQARMRERLYQAQKMKAVGELAGGVAHDFNNQLLVMFAGIEQLGELATGDAAQRALQVIRQAAREAQDVTQALITVSHPDAVGTQHLNLGRLLEELPQTLQLMLPAAIELRVHNRLGLPFWTRGNLSQLRRVILNLVANSRDAMPDGGRLTVSLAPATTADCRRCGVEPAPPRVALVVADDGHGMPPETLARILEPFFTTRARTRGTGLGLAIADRIIRDHDGALDIESEVGRGTTATVLLPLAPPPEAGSGA